MDTGNFKLLELLLIVGVVGYFYLQQRQSLQRLKAEREAKQQQDQQREVEQGDTDNVGIGGPQNPSSPT